MRKSNFLLGLGILGVGLLVAKRVVSPFAVTIPSINISPGQGLIGTVNWQQNGIRSGDFDIILQYHSATDNLWHTTAQAILTNVAPNASYSTKLTGGPTIETNEPINQTAQVRVQIINPVDGSVYSEADGGINIISGLAATITGVTLSAV